MTERQGSESTIGLDARVIADSVRAGKISASDVLEQHLAHIERANAPINAMVFVDADRARAVAAEIDAKVARGDDPGPLAGVPLGIKELEATEGWPDTRASTAFKDRIATTTTTMTKRLLGHGAVPVGQTASPEMGMLFFTNSVLHGATRNPWDTERTTGGSSGGAGAALASGLVALATGSDMGGSIRVPAGWCGVVGVKGTLGRIPRGPGYIGGANLIHYGPLARSVGDAARYLDCAVGVDQRDPMSLPVPALPFERAIDELDVSGLRVALCATTASPDRGRGVGRRERGGRRPGRRAGAEGSRSRVRAPVDLLDLGGALFQADVDPGMADAFPEIMTNLLNTEGAAPLLAAAFDPAGITIDGIAKANQCRYAVNMVLAALFDQIDVLLMPTTPFPAFGACGPLPTLVAGREVGPAATAAFVGPFNFSGNPVVSVPAGLVDGVPVGMQIVGRRHDDALVLALAARFEELRPWPKLAP